MIFFQILYILNVFIAPLFLKATFDGYRILGWQDLTPSFLLPDPLFLLLYSSVGYMPLYCLLLVLFPVRNLIFIP